MRATAALAALVAAASTLLVGCGEEGSSTAGDDAAPSSAAGLHHLGVVSSGFDRGSVDVTVEPDPPVAGAQVTWSFRVVNLDDDPMTLTFASGKRADVALVRDGRERYRWSDGRAFVQASDEVLVAPGDEVTFDLGGTLDVAPGVYDLTAELASGPAPSPMGATVDVVEET